MGGAHPEDLHWQHELLDRLRVATGHDRSNGLTDEQLAMLLEAAAYDLDYAVVLYWDSIADTDEHHHQQQNNHVGRRPHPA